MGYEGIVNVLKPPGMTSSDVVSDIRRIFSMKKVGHTGTLDPGASGVLPICLGRATRLFDYLMEKDKEYIAQLTFGLETDTQDSYGTVTERSEPAFTMDELSSAIDGFKGEQTQYAPLYSAVRVDGRQLYKFARAGEKVETKSRTINVRDIELLGQSGDNSFMLRIVCTKGTYIRTLCSDIGKMLSTNAYMSFLLRTRSGEFSIEDTYTLDELRACKESGTLEKCVVPACDALPMLKSLYLENISDREKRLLINGASLETTQTKDVNEFETVKVFLDGKFIGLATKNDAGFHLSLSFNGVQDDE